MTNEQQRAEFEAWARSEHYIIDRREDGRYESDYTDSAWFGYQARANSGWLQDAVIVLEEGAEPQEGDLVCHPSGRLGYVQSYEDGQVFIDVHGGDWDCKKEHLVGGIIQRNGKPVVYKPKGE